MRAWISGVLILIVGMVALMGCGASGSTVATLGGEKLTLPEFEAKYAKYNGGWDKAKSSTMEEREKFLDLLVNFRLKVMEAKRQGLLNDPDVQHEIEGYRLTVASTYATEKLLVEPSVRDLYERKSQEVRVSHILFRLNPTSTPEDTLKQYNKAMELLARLTPANFDSLARVYSEDTSAKTSGPDLGYFSQGRMVKEFEDAAYSLKPGQICKAPIRTQYGYHLIFVKDRKPNEGSIGISHILRRFNQRLSDTLAVRDSVEFIYHRLQEGLSFEEAAKLYSQDPYTNGRGGEIGYFERERIPPDMADVLFNTPVDSITPPVRAPYGFHIFKVTGKRGIPSYEDLHEGLLKMFKDRFYATAYENFLQRLKKKQHLKLNVETMVRLEHAFDTTKTPSVKSWSDTLRPDLRASVLFTYADQKVTVNDFVRLVNSLEEFKPMLLVPISIDRMEERITELLVLSHALEASPYRDDFEAVIQEYRDGILLYRIEQDEVWKKIQVTDSALQDYYHANVEKFKWPKRVDFAEIQVRSDSLAKAIYARLQAGEDFSQLAEEYTVRPGYADRKGHWGLVAETLNKLSRAAASMAVDSITPPKLIEGKWSIIEKLGSDSVHTKTFDEALAEVTSGYQEQAAKEREEEWLRELRAKYDVELDKKPLATAFTEKQGAKQ